MSRRPQRTIKTTLDAEGHKMLFGEDDVFPFKKVRQRFRSHFKPLLKRELSASPSTQLIHCIGRVIDSVLRITRLD